jgi:hypothetical protein
VWRASELEGVLQQVGQRGEQEFPVASYVQLGIDGRNLERNLGAARL